MPITNSEQGAITEAEFVKFVMLTSDGWGVPTHPVVDDEPRDYSPVDWARDRRVGWRVLDGRATLPCGWRDKTQAVFEAIEKPPHHLGKEAQIQWGNPH